MTNLVHGFLWLIGSTPILRYFCVPIPFYALGMVLYAFSFKSKK